MDFDDVLPHIGDYGFYQKLMFCVLAIPANIPAAFSVFNIVFISAVPDHWCRVPELEEQNLSLQFIKNVSIPLELKDGKWKHSKCKMYDVNYTQLIEDIANGYTPIKEDWAETDCKYGWNYDRSLYHRTLPYREIYYRPILEALPTEATALITLLLKMCMDIVCDYRWMTSFANSMFYVGSLGGSLTFGYLGDKYGRRPAFFAMLIIHLIFGILACFPPNYTFYIVYRFMIGTCYPSLFQLPFIMVLELISPGKRAQSGMVLCIIFSLAMVLLAGLAYSVKDWFYLSVICSFPFVSLLSYWWFLPESPRWLLSCNRINEAEVIVQKISKANEKNIAPDFLKSIMEKKGVLVEDKTPDPSIFDLLRYPNIRKKFLIVSFGWIVNSIVYTGLSLGATLLGVNDYLGFAISGLVEIPGLLISWFAMERLGRCWVICLTMVIGGLACMCTAFVPADFIWVTVTLSNIGKFCITGSFAVIYVYGCELFPTVLRSIALATACFISSIGLILAPHLLTLSESYGRAIPVIVMGAISAAGGLSILFLPETLNSHLPQTIEEGENFGKDVKFLSCPWTKSMEFDEVLPHVGSYGKYQILLLGLLAPVANIPCCFTYLSVAFVSATPDHWCRIPELEGHFPQDVIKNISIPLETRDGVEMYSQCAMYDYNYTRILLEGVPSDVDVPRVPCKNGWNYDRSVYESTLVTDMDVVCEDRWLQSLAESSYFFGTIVGSIIFGNLGNIYGRKPTFYVLLFLNIVAGILSAFPPNYTAYIVYRAFIGTTSIVIFQIPFILAMEMMSPQKRSVSGMFICTMFPVSISFMCLLAYLSRNWFILSLLTSFPLILFFIIWYFVPESPRWLMTQNRIDEAEVIVQKMAKINKKKIEPNFLRNLMTSKGINHQEDKKPDKKLIILQMIKYPNIRKKFFIISYGWLVNAIVYVGLLLGATMFSINDYLSVTISGLVELPGVLISWWAMDRYGRRTVILTDMVVGGLACVCAGFVPGDYIWTIVILANIGKLCITGSYSTIYCFGSELFPTVLRTLALATASLVGSIGAITAPYILYLGALYGKALPVIILGVLSVSGGICTLFLPETLNENLPETLEEGEQFGKDAKVCQFPCTNRQKKEPVKMSRFSMHRDSKTISLYDYGV
ncbi:uncharacterized protein [Centruroides vittatus]|uniref:uncharacterized protein n=1 Tax=Centruroides vittatus TaxID=120091 RepID=UPI00350F2050